MYRLATVLFAAVVLTAAATPGKLTARKPAAIDVPKGQVVSAGLIVKADQLRGASFYVRWSYYKKNTTTGATTRKSSGRAGPYSTRRDAQSYADYLLGTGTTVGGYYYYYSARVVP
jgi:hypothetical protein